MYGSARRLPKDFSVRFLRAFLQEYCLVLVILNLSANHDFHNFLSSHQKPRASVSWVFHETNQKHFEKNKQKKNLHINFKNIHKPQTFCSQKKIYDYLKNSDKSLYILYYISNTIWLYSFFKIGLIKLSMLHNKIQVSYYFVFTKLKVVHEYISMFTLQLMFINRASNW